MTLRSEQGRASLVRALGIEVALVLRKLDAVIRVTAALTESDDRCRVVHAILGDYRERLAGLAWVRRWPVEDAFWPACISELSDEEAFSKREAAECFDELERVASAMTRLSQWLQIAFGTVAPHARPPATASGAASESPRARAENLRKLAYAVIGESLSLAGTRPTRILIAAGDHCNFRCRTCYQSLHQDFSYNDISWTNLAHLVDAFAAAHTVHVGGFGEPLLSNATPTIIAAASAAGAATALTTNGSLLHRLEGFPQIDRIEISLDAASASVLETIRKGSQFLRIVDGIGKLGAEQRRRICFNVVVNKLNVEEIAGIALLAKNLGVGEIVLQSFDAYLPWHRDMLLTEANFATLERQIEAARWIAPRVTIRDLVVRGAAPNATDRDKEEILTSLESIGFAAHVALEDGNHIIADLSTIASPTLQTTAPARFLARLEPVVREHFEGRGDVDSDLPYCMEPYGSMVINADGVINPCCRLAWNMGNLNDTTVETIWKGTQYTALRAAHRTRRNMPATCQTCTDPSRYSNLPGLLEALEVEGADFRRLRLPGDYAMPPDLEARVVAFGIRPKKRSKKEKRRSEKRERAAKKHRKKSKDHAGFLS